jgi:hypothetical protein
VFYVPGFDPFPPRRYRELFRTEAAAQGALSGHRIRIGRGRSAHGWSVEARIEGRDVLVDYDVLVWHDLVQASMGQGILQTYSQLLRTAWVYLRSGALFRLAGLRGGPTIAALYPFGVLLGQLAVSVVAGWLLWRVAGGILPTAVALALAGALAWLLLLLFRKSDGRIFAWYLMHDYAHTASAQGAYPPELQERLARFADRISEALADDWDEVLVIGHSSGAHLAVSAVAEVLRREPAGRGGRLALLTLGQVIPMLTFLPEARQLRRDLLDLSVQDTVPWIDVTAPGDGCSYALCDPVSVTGLAGPDKKWPLVLSAAFSQTLKPETLRRLRHRYFRLHFQYLCAFDNLPGATDDYDFFAITSGPMTLRDRLGRRKPSASRIERPASPHRTVEGRE